MAYSQLRELARTYAAGHLSREDYRERRAEFLDNLLHNRTNIDYRDLTAAQPLPVSAPIIDVGEDEPEVRRTPIILGGIAIVLALFAAAFWYVRVTTAVPTAVVVAAPVAESVALVSGFLRQRDLGAEACAAFLERWQALDEGARDQARADKAWTRLAFSLKSAVRDQQALVPVDDTGAAVAEEARLRRFAAALDIHID